MIKRHLSPRPLPLLLCLAILLTASSVPAQPLFTTTNYAAGIYPRDIAIADFNGDGYDDLAVANSYWGEEPVKGVAILLNDGSGGYAAPVIHQTGESADDIHAGDLNGDGYPDVAVVSRRDDKLTILLNDGHGAFPEIVEYTVSGSPFAVRIADFNNDGKPDVATTSGANVTVMINKGDGTLAGGVGYNVGNPIKVDVGDVNNDGHTDIAVTNGSFSGVSLLLNNGDGTFATQTTYPVGAYANYVIINDLNNDGWKDLAVTNRTGNSVSVLLNNGNGTFATQAAYAVGDSPAALAAGDLDGDGYAELVIADGNFDADITVLLNNGNGTFSLMPAFGEREGTRIGVGVADLDSDGRNDIVVSLGGLNVVSVFLNSSELPVTLTAFKAMVQEQSALLTWSASGEVNFSHFEIQRGTDGMQWQRVGEVVAAGRNDAPLVYLYSDDRPLPGLSYYRLKMIDLDGTYAYSNIRSVIYRTLPERDLEVYPNPASGQVSLTTTGAVSEVLLRDISGRLLRKVSSYDKEKSIPVSGLLGPGVVLVEVRYTDGRVEIGKVVVAR